jgi:hypothetical protein
MAHPSISITNGGTGLGESAQHHARRRRLAGAWSARMVLLLLVPGAAHAAPDPGWNPQIWIQWSQEWRYVDTNGDGVPDAYELWPVVVTPLCDDFLQRNPGTDPALGCTPATGYEGINHDGADFSNVIGQYGPRRTLASAGMVNDFHRGVDMAFPDMEDENGDPGTRPLFSRPVFAVADGTVSRVEYTFDDDDPSQHDGFRMTIEHRDDNREVYYSVYKHLWAVPGHSNKANPSASVHDCGVDAVPSGLAEGTPITVGQFIGCTGFSKGGLHHLHVETRKTHDLNRTAVHPFRFYERGGQFTTAYTEHEASGQVVVDVISTSTARNSLVRVVPYQTEGGVVIEQPGSMFVNGYHVYPSIVDFEQMNYEYSHEPGDFHDETCPFLDEHGASYDSNVHFKDGEFNGISIYEPVDGNANDRTYSRIFTIGNFQQWGECSVLELADPADQGEVYYECD